MSNQIENHSMDNKKKENHLCVGYLVPSKEVKGELEFKRCIDSQQSHLKVFYEVKDEFNLEKSSSSIIAEVEEADGYCMLEPLYVNKKTNSMIYVDALTTVVYDSSQILLATSAFDAAMEHIGYQITYSKDDMKIVLDKMTFTKKGITKRK